MISQWIKVERNARGLCADCGTGPRDITWAGTGLDICWSCRSKRAGAYWADRLPEADPDADYRASYGED